MNSKKEPIDKMTEESATLHATQLLEWIINDSKGSNKVGVHLETTKTKTKWSVQLWKDRKTWQGPCVRIQQEE